ncbi:hypothetical protein [Burkholderia sp. 8Y]|uniref:hypothetical protein n=1 Tax=Burkholderia sp. 8Y TaxID=2653133 RepID=UPI00135862E7|nr:hypothetical protein [Burkholderia sp. 8Y]
MVDGNAEADPPHGYQLLSNAVVNKALRVGGEHARDATFRRRNAARGDMGPSLIGSNQNCACGWRAAEDIVD